MAISKSDLIRAKLKGIMTTLERAPAGEKKNRISMALADDFNSVLQSIADEYEELKDALPKRIERPRGALATIGQAELTFMDLEAMCEQALNLLNLVDQA